jgi:hypothetical protein
VDENVKKRHSESAAKAYLGYLISDAAQEIFAQNGYRPIKKEIARKHRDLRSTRLHASGLGARNRYVPSASGAVSVLTKLGFQKLNLSLHLRELLVEQSILSRIFLQRISCTEPLDGYHHAPQRFGQRVGNLGTPFCLSVDFT